MEEREYKIPVEMAMYGVVNVRAKTLFEAIEKARIADLPEEKNYIEDSFSVNEDLDLIKAENKIDEFETIHCNDCGWEGTEDQLTLGIEKTEHGTTIRLAYNNDSLKLYEDCNKLISVCPHCGSIKIVNKKDISKEHQAYEKYKTEIRENLIKMFKDVKKLDNTVLDKLVEIALKDLYETTDPEYILYCGDTKASCQRAVMSLLSNGIEKEQGDKDVV